MTPKDAAELLDTIAKKAKALRDAGMLEVGLGEGVYVKLAPAELPESDGDDEQEEDVDVLDDPATYGRRSGVPGRKRKERR